MSVPIIAFFNNKGGVGKTSLVYHLAWMYAEKGVRILAADLDPQANLTVAFLDEERIGELWCEPGEPGTIYGCLEPLIEGIGDIREPRLERTDKSLFETASPGLLAGSLTLSQFEDELAESWSKAQSERPLRPLRILSAFWRILQNAAIQFGGAAVLIDLGPNLGAINRAALIAADHVVVPLSPDVFSLQGLKNLGPRVRSWREQWAKRARENRDPNLPLPPGSIEPIGYVVLQHSVRLDRPVKAYERWIERIPRVYAEAVLGTQPVASQVQDDSNCLALLRHYRSLMPMAQEAGKPMFLLKPGDGAIGAHLEAVHRVRAEFSALADVIFERIGLSDALDIPA